MAVRMVHTHHREAVGESRVESLVGDASEAVVGSAAATVVAGSEAAARELATAAVDEMTAGMEAPARDSDPVTRSARNSWLNRVVQALEPVSSLPTWSGITLLNSCPLAFINVSDL